MSVDRNIVSHPRVPVLCGSMLGKSNPGGVFPLYQDHLSLSQALSSVIVDGGVEEMLSDAGA